jgi:hypothetical protein
MEMKVQIPFDQLLAAIKTLTPTQKAKLKQELNEEKSSTDDKTAFIEMLLNGPVYSEKQIQTIEENRKSIAGVE